MTDEELEAMDIVELMTFVYEQAKELIERLERLVSKLEDET